MLDCINVNVHCLWGSCFKSEYSSYIKCCSKLLHLIIFSNLAFCDVLQVRIDPLPGKKVEHTGVKIELLGQIGTTQTAVWGC